LKSIRGLIVLKSKIKSHLLYMMITAAIPSFAVAQSQPTPQRDVDQNRATVLGEVVVTGDRPTVTTVAVEQAEYGTEVQIITGETVEQSGASVPGQGCEHRLLA
jgi:hypothetical protein